MKQHKRFLVALLCTLTLLSVTDIQAKNYIETKSYVQSKTFRLLATGVTEIKGTGDSDNIIYKKNGNAYTVGWAYEGCLGSGKKKAGFKVVMTPSKIGVGVDHVYAGCSQALYTKKGKLYFCGNGAAGMLWLCSERYCTPTRYHDSSFPKKVRRLWIGNETMAYGKGNSLYASGSVLHGWNPDEYEEPRCILKDKLNQVKDVSVSSHFIIVQYKNGTAEIMGLDSTYRSSCIGKKRLYEKLVPYTKFGKDVKKFISGDDVIGAIKKNGDFYLCGSNEFHLLGKKSSTYETAKPRLMMRNVKDVSAPNSSGRILVLKKDGTVWSWGHDAGSYAINGAKYVNKPVKIASGVKQIASTMDANIIVKNNGTAYWKGEFGYKD